MPRYQTIDWESVQCEACIQTFGEDNPAVAIMPVVHGSTAKIALCAEHASVWQDNDDYQRGEAQS